MHNNLEKPIKFEVDGRSFTLEDISGKQYDLVQIDKNQLHLLLDDESILATVVDIDIDQKLVRLMIEGVTYEVQIENALDELIRELGFDQLEVLDEKEIKAPMPGLVLEILVKVGQTVSAGDNLIILEAMKMENVLQAPNAGVIKSIEVKKTNSVEKNQILINFE